MATTKQHISPGRLLLFTLLATVLFLAGLEGLARVVEPRYFPYQRTIPIPAPWISGAKEFNRATRDARARLKDPPTKRGIPLVEDASRGWALAPSADIQMGSFRIQTNSWGLRGPELTDPEPGEVRLMTLGDSTIFGDGVDEPQVFSDIAARVLSKKWDRKVVDVIGASPGHDTRQSFNTLLQYGSRIHPSWVVIGNLWSDIYRGDQRETELEASTYLPPLRDRLRGYALYRVLRQLLGPFLNSRKVRFMTSRDDIGSLHDGPATRVPLTAYVQNLRRMVERAHELGAKVAFVILAAPMDLDKVPPPDTVQEFRLAMKQVAEENGAPLVDGPRVFKEKGATIGYFDDQVHPNAEGHFLLGAELARVLEPVGPPPPGASTYAAGGK